MDLHRKRKVNKPWKLHRKVKLAKFLKKLKPTTNTFIRILAPLLRIFSYPLLPRRPSTKRDDQDIAFMALIIQVNTTVSGWEKSLSGVLKLCRGTRFKMDQEGRVEISGITNPKVLLKKMGKSKGLEVQWYQFGQCCSYLVMPENQTEEKPKVDCNNFQGYHKHQQVPQHSYFYKPYGQHSYFQRHRPYGPF